MTYKIINIKPLSNHPGMYNFSISMGGFIFNGFTYVPSRNDKKSAIMVATFGPRKQRLVRGHGIHFKRLKERFEQHLKEEFNAF